ncbi:glutamate 5-kinase [Magnetospira thiophila]
MNAAQRAKSGLDSAQRIVVKIGSALLVDESKGVLRRRWLEALAEDLVALHKQGRDVIIVSSGSIAVGRRYLSLGSRALRLDEKQAAAAAGMIRLAHAYQETLGHHDLIVAQVLLTLDDTESRRRYINARNTLGTLLDMRAVPLINENDTVATDEIRFGDNDRLAARVAAMISADTLVLLSDIDGLYTADPHHDDKAQLLTEVHEITPEIEAMAGDPVTAHGSGGMVTKLAAARICLGAGCRMVITKGHDDHPLKRLAEGARATWFLPQATPARARKQWIAGSLKPVGTLWLDPGAVKALHQGKSLLPAGVTKVEGTFERGAAVIIRSPEGHEMARGLMTYPSADARRIAGHKTAQIEQLLGYRGPDEMIHRDDLVLL